SNVVQVMSDPPQRHDFASRRPDPRRQAASTAGGPRLAAGAGTVAAAIEPQLDQRLQAAAQRAVANWADKDSATSTVYRWLRDAYVADNRIPIDDLANIARTALPDFVKRVRSQPDLPTRLDEITNLWAKSEAEGGLSPDQFAMLAKEPRLLGLMFTHPQLAMTYAEGFPNFLDTMLRYEDIWQMDVELLEHFVDRGRDVLDRLESNYYYRQAYFGADQLEALRRLGKWSHLVFDHNPSVFLMSVLVKTPLTEAIIDSRDPAAAFVGVNRSLGLTDELFTRVHVSSPWPKENFDLLIQDPRLLDALQDGPAAVGAIVRVPGMLAAAAGNLDVVQVLHDNPDLADVLIDSPVIGERLAGSIELLRAAARNTAVAEWLSRNPAHFDSISADRLLDALEGATPPPAVGQLPGVPTSPEKKAVAKNSALRAAVLDGSLPPELRKSRYNLLKRNPDLADVLAANPKLLSHPHEYGRLLDGFRVVWQGLADDQDLVGPLLPALLRSHAMRTRFLLSAGESGVFFRQVAEAARDNQAHRKVLLRSGGLRLMTAEYPTPLGVAVSEFPEMIELLSRSERILAIVPLPYTDTWSMLFRTANLGRVLLNNEGLVRLLVQNFPLVMLLVEPKTSDRASGLLRHTRLPEHPKLAGLLAEAPHPRLTSAHWEALLSAPAFFDYLGVDSELWLASMLVAEPDLLFEIASRPIPNSVGELAAIFDGPVRESLALRHSGSGEWPGPLRVGAESLGERLLSPEGVFMEPEIVPLAMILREPDDEKAGSAVRRAGLSPEASAALLDRRERVRQHRRLAASVERHLALAVILNKEPQMVDVLEKLPDLLDFLDRRDGRDGHIVLQTMSTAPKVFEAMLQSDALYHYYMTNSSVREDVHAEGEKMARQVSILQLRQENSSLILQIGANAQLQRLMYDVPSVGKMMLAHQDRAFELLAREGFAGVLAAQEEGVVDAAVSHLSLLRFLSANPGEVSTLGSV
ncbi:hypothetical protein AB0J84_31460, partial [Micromonospora arborensis]|uniref:hypothetical protein n=1 Tax=Micromonospora arborensis TaxID=2116518 RepID=UPI0034389597